MTLTPAEVAKLDQIMAEWTEWYADQTDAELARLYSLVGSFVNQMNTGGHDRQIVHGIFKIGLSSLQLATHSMRSAQ